MENNTNQPLVSVVICTNNRMGTLKTAIESVFLQTYKNYEIIVLLADSCMDNSNDFLLGLKERGMIKYSINKGTRIDARNTGLKLATGKYVRFLDDDDYILKNNLEVMVNYLERNNHIDVVGCSTLIDSQTAINNTMLEMSNVDVLRLLESDEDIDDVINFQSCLFRKSSLDKFYPDQNYFDNLFITGGEGQHLLYDMIINHGARIANTSNTIYIYHVGAAQNSLTAHVVPEFYEQHLFRKPWIDKKSFIRTFHEMFALEEKLSEDLYNHTTAEIETYTTSENPNPASIKIDEPTLNLEVPVKKTRKPRKKKEEVKVEEVKAEETPKKKRGRPKKVKTEE